MKGNVRYGPEADIRLFDHLVGAGEYGRRNCEAQCFRGLEVDHEFVLGWRLHRHVTRIFALKDAINVSGRAAELVSPINPVGDQAAARGLGAIGVDLRAVCVGPQA